MKSSKEIILEYLKRNRGREIPVAEIRKQCKMKLSTISNATKELHYQGLIDIERRPLKRGRYTVIWLSRDTITEEGQYHHKNELINKEDNQVTPAIELETKSVLQKDPQLNIDSLITYLKSIDYDAIIFQERLDELGMNAFELVTRIISPLLREVGEEWSESHLTAAEEHVISTRVTKYLATKVSNKNGKRGTLIMAPVEGESHTISLLALEYILTSQDYHVINLAHSIPVNSLIDYINGLEKLPNWVLFSITLDIYLGTLKREIKALKEEFGDKIRIAIGGQGITEDERNSIQGAEYVVLTVKDLDNFVNNLASMTK